MPTGEPIDPIDSAYPILEFDPSPEAVLEPSRIVKPRDVPIHCVLCFFLEAITRLRDEGKTKEIYAPRWESGRHPMYELEWNGKRVALLHPGVGAPMAAGFLEQAIALGCRKFIACGGAGVLDKNIVVGHLIIPATAVRDEGTSYHYLPPGREVSASPEGVAAIERVLQARQIEYIVSKTWTTDAPYRETVASVRRRKAEGCLTVEMEAAAFFAVARFRQVTFAQMLYGGDDVSGSEWDGRGWYSREEIRGHLLELALQACLEL
jgi:uridine phosphorylase